MPQNTAVSAYTYIVKCSDNTLYTGWTNDLEKRIKTHNAGKGAKYTKSRLPVTLCLLRNLPNQRRGHAPRMGDQTPHSQQKTSASHIIYYIAAFGISSFALLNISLNLLDSLHNFPYRSKVISV